MNKEENMEREIDESFLDKKFKENSFKVPANYFDNLQEQILAVSKIPSTQTETDFKITENYFEDLNVKILSQVAIAQHSKENNFKVPDLYFDKLQSNILAKTAEQKKTRVLRFPVAKYAAAAMLLLTTTFGVYFFNTNNETVSDKIASIPEEDISDYLKFHTDPNDVSFIIESTDDFSLIEEEFARQFTN